MRTWVPALVAIGLVGLGIESAAAQAWPTKQPIKIIVPFSAGSATDIIARTVFEQVSVQLGQATVVENRVGAGGTLGMAAVAKAEPDGYTVLVNSSSHTVVPSTYASLPFDPVKGFTAVTPLANLPNVLVVAKTKGYKSVRELVEAAKARPGAMNYASAGAGSAAHLSAERFRMSAGFEAQHIPYKGAPEALREIVAGRVDFYFCPVLPALPLIGDGQLGALAVSGGTRASALPEAPTTVEAGYANSDYNFWIGLFVTADTPRAVVERLHAEVTRALAQPAVKERLTRLGAEPMAMTPAAFDAHVGKEIEANAALVKAAGIKIN